MLVEFWGSRKSDAAIAERDLSAWYKLASRAEWSDFAGLKRTFGSADRVGNCVVFDVGNNRDRLIARVNFNKGILYVLRVMDHRQYDTRPWARECGCHEPPPRKPAPPGKAARPERPGRK
jgi:mRNA interferase HigB